MPGLLNFFSIDTLRNPWFLLIAAFTLWMFIDAIRRQEYIWAVFIFFFPGLSPILYFFLVYRSAPSATQGFELPGTYNRKRINELKGHIHHLDKAHHHAELGDIYFHQGKLQDAEQCYRAAIERDPSDCDFHAHLGQCLLRQGRAQEAVPLLEKVVRENPRHDYGHSLMAYAETLAKLDRKDEAIAALKQVLEHHTYARARAQLAQFYIDRGEKDLARKELTDLLADEAHSASFEKRKDKLWIQKAKSLLKQLG